MSTLNLYMAGSGNWHPYFPSEDVHDLYLGLYGRHADVRALAPAQRDTVTRWAEVGFVHIDGHTITARVPLYTDKDEQSLRGLLNEIAEQSCSRLQAHLPAYRDLAGNIASEHQTSTESVLLIMMCAYTLDLGTLGKLQERIIGGPPRRGDSGTYFLFGLMTMAARRFFGVRGNGFLRDSMFWYIHGWFRRSSARWQTISLPVFDSQALARIHAVCDLASADMGQIFLDSAKKLTDATRQCTFGDCPEPDRLCTVFHVGYPLVFDQLVRHGLIPTFPDLVEDNLGMWITTA
jgi:hypothetical protein